MIGVAPGYAYYFDYLTKNIRPAFPGSPHTFEITYVFGSLALMPQAPIQAESGGDQCARIERDIADFKKDSKLAGVSAVVADWIAGDVDAFTALKVRQPGGEFTQEVWKALRKVRGGTVISYANLAAKAGRPLAVRAAGTAMAANLIAPIVPCHRVVKTGGALGAYGFGVDLKAKLLQHEGFHL